MRTTVYGTIYDSSGEPYKGAIVKFLPDKAYRNGNEWIQDVEARVTTNSYGKFEIDLPPSERESFYFMTIVYDKVLSTLIIVPMSDTPVNFLDLKEYLYPYERDDDTLGCC